MTRALRKMPVPMMLATFSEMAARRPRPRVSSGRAPLPGPADSGRRGSSGCMGGAECRSRGSRATALLTWTHYKTVASRQPRIGAHLDEGVAMLNRLLPQPADNAYRGHPIALWLFGLLVAAKLIIAVNTMFRGSTVARTADGIPLDTFAPDAAQTLL